MLFDHEMFINSGTTMCKYGHTHGQLHILPEGALMTTHKLYQKGTLFTLCNYGYSRTLKTVPV